MIGDVPPIQYARTSDGANIAYWAVGQGPAVIQMPNPWGHLRNEWELPEIASWYQRLGDGRMLIAYDGRGGAGLSAHPEGATDPSSHPGAVQLADLEALLDAVGVRRVAILASWFQAWTALRFASQCPERVSRLVLWMTATRGADLISEDLAAIADMGAVNQDRYARLLLHSIMGWSAGDAANRFVDAVLPAPGTGQVGSAVHGGLGILPAIDVTNLAATLTVPTLVLHARESQLLTEATATTLAASIPGARLVLLDGESLFLPFGVADQALHAINSFLTQPEQRPASATMTETEADEGAAGGPPYPDRLSEREVQVLRLVAAGMKNAEIADRLVISINTVTRHITNIFGKIGVTNRTEATRYAIRSGLTE